MHGRVCFGHSEHVDLGAECGCDDDDICDAVVVGGMVLHCVYVCMFSGLMKVTGRG